MTKKKDTQTEVASCQIYELMSEAAKRIGVIGKDRKVAFGSTRYNFRGIDDVYNSCSHVFNELGITLSPMFSNLTREVVAGPKGNTVHVTLMLSLEYMAPDGSSSITTTFGEALDTSDKAVNKAMSAAVKYAHFTTFSIPTEEKKDSEYDDIPVPASEGSKPSAKVGSNGSGDKAFCQLLGKMNASSNLQELNDNLPALKAWPEGKDRDKLREEYGTLKARLS